MGFGMGFGNGMGFGIGMGMGFGIWDGMGWDGLGWDGILNGWQVYMAGSVDHQSCDLSIMMKPFLLAYFAHRGFSPDFFFVCVKKRDLVFHIWLQISFLV